MMLRASANVQEKEVDLQGIAGDAEAASRGIAYGSELIGFAEAAVGQAGRQPDSEQLAIARERLRSAGGDAVVVDAAGVIANFQRMVRIADSTGIPVDALDATIKDELNLASFPSAVNSAVSG